MAFLNFMKKREELLGDIDLDVPPEPPKMMEEEISTEGPIDEELMPIAKKKKLKGKAPKAKEEEELPELPPLPEMEEEVPPLPEVGGGEEVKEFPEIPPLPEEELEGVELPPPPEIKKERKGFFSFLKPKKTAEELELPRIEEEILEMPPLPEVGGGEEVKEFPEIPPLPEEEEAPPLPREKERYISPQPMKPLKQVVEKPIKEKRFITIDDFRQIQSDISNTKAILKDVDVFFSKLEEVKGSMDRRYAGLCNDLQDIQKKLMFIDSMLFKEV